MSNQAINSDELKLCESCSLEPLPESAQHWPFIILELILVFINVKFALVMLCVGYCFSKTVWICPLCKRDLTELQSNQNTSSHIIIRVGDCMMLLSKNKFRLVAVAVIALLIYLYMQEPEHKPKIPINKSWKSLVTNCGYESHLENSVRANALYNEYQNLGQWEFDGIFISKDKPGRRGDIMMKVKMNPSQFVDPKTEDFRVFIQDPKIELNQGDEIRLYGNWKGRVHHFMILAGDKVEKTGRTINLSSVETFSKGIRRAGTD